MTPEELVNRIEETQAELREWTRKRNESVTIGQYEMATFMRDLLQVTLGRLVDQINPEE